MRSKVDAKAFIRALDKVGGLIRKSSIPALDAVLVQFEPDCCTLTATNLDTWLSIKLPAQGDGFTFLLGRPRETARAFRQFDGELALEQTETDEGVRRIIKLALSCGRRSGELFVFPPKDFPTRQEWAPKHSFTANAAELYACVERVRYAAAAPNLKHAANRSCVQFSGSNIYAVDGYRMAWCEAPGFRVPTPFMASPEALSHLKLFGANDAAFRLGDRYALATDGETTLTFHLPGCGLFKLDSAIPDKFQAEFDVSPKEFLDELAYLKRALRGNTRHKVRFSGGELSAESRDERYATRIRADGGESITFGFDLAYMMDALEQFKKEPLAKMKFSGPLGPIIMEAEGRNDHAMVLPIQLKDGSMAA